MKCILFIFAGRKLYLEIQKKYLRVLLYRFPFLEIHFWNFTRNEEDNEYIQILAAELPRTKIFNHLYDGENEETNCTKRIGKLCACRKCRVGRWAESYRFYAAQPHSEENIYVKLDDDILYLDTHRFYQFCKFAKDNPEKIISANVFNNGVCALHNPRLRDEIIEAGLVTSLNHESWWGL